MADQDGFDSAFADEPEEPPRRGRRSLGGRRRRGREPADSASTGEVPRSRMRGSLPPDDDFGFDDDPAPAPQRGRGRRRGRRPPPRRSGGSGGGAAVLRRPGARLGLGLAFAAILILVITLVVRDCQRNRLEDSYTRYMNSVAQLVSTSAEQGQQLRQVVNNSRGDRPPQLSQRIRGIAGEAQALVEQANDLDPPGALSEANGSLITALEYRVTGLRTLADQLPSLLQSREPDFTANGLAKIMQRFLASDVIYADSFAGPARTALEEDDIGGVEVPPEQPFLPNPGLAAPGGARNLVPNLQRRTPQGGDQDQAGGGGNLRGTSLARVEALPSETALTPGQTVSVQASEQLKWRITVENGGDFDETGIVVKTTFRYPSAPDEADEREAQIEAIASGETTTVEIPGPTAPIFGEEGVLLVAIEPVPGETNVDNNSGEYPVRIVI